MSSSMIWSICLCSLSKIQLSSAISLPPQDARGSEAGCRGSSAGIGGEGEKCEGGEKRSTMRHVDLVSMPRFSPTAKEDAVDRDLVPAGAKAARHRTQPRAEDPGWRAFAAAVRRGRHLRGRGTPTSAMLGRAAALYPGRPRQIWMPRERVGRRRQRRRWRAAVEADGEVEAAAAAVESWERETGRRVRG